MDTMLSRPGLLFKRLALLFGAMFFTFVAVTNLVNFIASVGDYTWTFLNSGNAAYIESVVKVYDMPSWFVDASVFAAFVGETIGAILFWRAVIELRGDGRGQRATWFALCWGILVWIGFIAGTEFFLAYGSESPFRELLVIYLAIAIAVAVIPDDAGRRDDAAGATSPTT
jgi:hypothetical protein